MCATAGALPVRELTVLWGPGVQESSEGGMSSTLWGICVPDLRTNFCLTRLGQNDLQSLLQKHAWQSHLSGPCQDCAVSWHLMW